LLHNNHGLVVVGQFESVVRDGKSSERRACAVEMRPKAAILYVGKEHCQGPRENVRYGSNATDRYTMAVVACPFWAESGHARISEEVTKRFYNLSAVHCPRGGIARYSFSTEKFACRL